MIHTKSIIRAAVVCVGFGIGSAAIAQTANERTPARAGTTATTVEARGDDRGDQNWNWIGLLGLAGLAGLMRRKDGRVVTQEPRRDSQDFNTRPAPR